MRWEEIAGHSGVVSMLRTMLRSGQVPHAVLFAGPSGLGKMLTARVFAAGLLCTGGQGEKPCGGCAACRQITQGTHPDLLELASDGASLKIDQIRALQHEAALAPYHGFRRVVILEESERLTTQAANSLLKVLEEPPTETVFILTASSPHILLSTVVSRCRVLSFRPLTPKVLTEFLAAKGWGASEATVAARLSGGRVGKALALLAPEGLALRDRAATIVAALTAGGPEIAWEAPAALDKLEAKDLAECLSHISLILRDLFVLLSGQEELLLNPDLSDRLRPMTAEWDEERLCRAIAAVAETQRALGTNANTRLACEAMFIKLLEAAKEGY
ncbi:MAG TPA: DNA polymerase III subunit delta' [Selenomonadales bacterium]|nr:DNA polymerase III subunit delta' [Selenomonadales bacterium]